MIWKLAVAAILVFHLAAGLIRDEPPPPPPTPTEDQGYGIDPNG